MNIVIEEAYRNLRTMFSSKIAPSGMLRCVTLVRTDVSEERSSSKIRVTRIGELGTTLTLTSNRHTLLLRSVRRLLFTANVFPNY
jgi:hypothetical protein